MNNLPQTVSQQAHLRKTKGERCTIDKHSWIIQVGRTRYVGTEAQEVYEEARVFRNEYEIPVEDYLLWRF